MVISTTTFTLFTQMSFLNRRYEGEKTTKKYINVIRRQDTPDAT